MKYLLFFLVAWTGLTNVYGANSWKKASIDLGEMTRGIDVADIDGDGGLEILATGETKVFAVMNPTGEPRLQVVADCEAGIFLYGSRIDADDDGDLDFVVARSTNPWIEYRDQLAKGEQLDQPAGPDFTLAWLENNGEASSPMPLHIIDTELHGIHGLCMADLDGDGREDIIANSFKGVFKDSLAWFQMGKGGATRHFIAKNTTEVRPHYMDAADLDNDGLLDALVACSSGDAVSWWRNPGSTDVAWEEYMIVENEKGATNVHAADFNGDGVLDVVVSNGHGKGVYWYSGPDWKKHAIDSEISDTHSCAIGDFDLDGDMDVAAASFTDKVVREYVNNGKGVFEVRDIDAGNEQESYDLKAVDLNQDGRLDLVLAGRRTNNAAWYLNLSEEERPSSIAGYRDREWQIATATQAAPESARSGATVLGYDQRGKLVTLREGSNDVICLADDPGRKGFSAASYHKSLEPFMARGRALKAEGKSFNEIFAIREEEAKSGKLQMPDRALLSVLTANVNEVTSELEETFLRYVFYIPFATSESTGLPLTPPSPGGPWIMDPGTHRAHIMITPPRK